MPRLRAAVGLPIAAFVLPLATVVSHSFGRSGFPLLLPAIKDDLELSNSQAGAAGTGMFLAYFAGVLTVTYFASRLEPVTILRIGLFVGSCGLGILAMATNLALLLLGLALISSGGAGIWITAPTLATKGVAPERRGIVIGLLTASIGLANSVVALSTNAARSSTGNDELWRPIYLGMAIASVLIGVTIFMLVRPDAQPSTKAPVAETHTQGLGRQAAPKSGFSFTNLKSLPGWKPVTLAYMSFGCIAAAYTSFLAEALEEDGGLTRDDVSLLYVGLGFGALIGSPIIGWMSDRTSRKTALLTVMGLMVVICLSVAVASGWVLIISVLCLGGLWVSYPTLTATYVRDHMDSRMFGQVYGTMTIFFSIASILPPFIVGAIADQQDSFRIPYLMLSGLALAAMGVLTRVPSQVSD